MTTPEGSTWASDAGKVLLPLGLGMVDPLSAAEVRSLLVGDGIRPKIIANLNLHGLYLRETHPSFKEFCERADVVLVDGWPVLALAMMTVRRRIPAARRIGSTDWVFPLIEEDAPLIVVAVGGTHESATRASRSVQAQTNNLVWHAFDGYDGRYCSAGPSISLDAALSQADLVLVGMGMPLQEEWIMRHLHVAPRAVFANVGGCIDYIAGVQSLAPRWLGALGIEWVFRLTRNPRRLMQRYFMEPIQLLLAVVKRVASPNHRPTR